MLKITSPVLRSGLVVAAVALLPLTEAAAQVSWDPSARNPSLTSRQCDIPAQSGGKVTIIAGPSDRGQNSVATQAAVFPVRVTSSAGPDYDANCPASLGTCLRWDYKWIYEGFNPSMVLVSVDSSVKVFAPVASPIYPPNSTFPSAPTTTFDTSINWGNVGGELGLRFTPSATSYNASIYSELAAQVGPVTAGFKGGNKNGFCAIAGANKSSADPNLSFSKDLVTTTLGCEVRWNQSADGCVTGVSVIGGACIAIQNAGASGKTHLVNLHNASRSASCGTEINAPGSTNVCKYNSLLRTYTCVCVADANGGC
jgi:hypothetical protein